MKPADNFDLKKFITEGKFLKENNIEEAKIPYEQMEKMEELAGKDNMDILRNSSRDIVLALVDNNYDDNEAIAFMTQYLKDFL
jgi:hypothetical protein